MSEIITIDELAAWLRISKNTIYDITSGRSTAKHPLPVLRIGKSIRFVRADIQGWIDRSKETA